MRRRRRRRRRKESSRKFRSLWCHKPHLFPALFWRGGSRFFTVTGAMEEAPGGAGGKRCFFLPFSCILFSGRERSSCLLLLQRRMMTFETNSVFSPLESSWASIFHKRGAEEDHFAVCCNLTSRFISFPEGELLFIGCFVSPPRPVRGCSCCLGRR